MAEGHTPLKNRMPYFFRVVEDLLGKPESQVPTKRPASGSLLEDPEESPTNGAADDRQVTYERFMQS